MSRIGRKPINIPAGVTASIADGVITVKGPKGSLDFKYNPAMTVEVKGDVIEVTRPDDTKENRSLHGLTRTLIHNMVIGVTEGYKKTLEVNGVGYRVQKQGNKCVMNLGYSHQVIVEDTDDIKIEVPDPNKIIITGIDKQKVGQFAAEVREKRPPEPYKGKGIKYADEVIRRKLSNFFFIDTFNSDLVLSLKYSLDSFWIDHLNWMGITKVQCQFIS